MAKEQQNIILGLDQYREVLAQIPEKGKWAAWKDGYYSQYQNLFDAMLAILYRANLDFLKPFVDAWDFERGLQLAEDFVARAGVDKVSRLAVKSAEFLNFEQAYDLYLLVGLGQVGGTALPGLKPFLYIGCEMWGHNLEQLNYVVPHEFLHMVRSQRMGSTEVLFGDLVVEEGLATAFSIISQGQEFTETIMLKSLLTMSEDDFKCCLENRQSFTETILGLAKSPLSAELMTKYLYSGSRMGEDGLPGNVGYYVGLALIINLLERGFDYFELVEKPAGEILGLLV